MCYWTAQPMYYTLLSTRVDPFLTNLQIGYVSCTLMEAQKKCLHCTMKSEKTGNSSDDYFIL